MARAKLTVLTFTAKSRPSRLAVLPGRTVAAIRRRQASNNGRYLIYKLPVLRRSGAAARLSCLHIPVETDTPPYSTLRLAIHGEEGICANKGRQNLSGSPLVDSKGLEPSTSAMRTQRSPDWGFKRTKIPLLRKICLPCSFYCHHDADCMRFAVLSQRICSTLSISRYALNYTRKSDDLQVFFF